MQLKEQPLEDDYPLYYGYLYVVGGRVFKNLPDFKTVGEMRRELVKAGLEKPDVIITSCDITGRQMWEHAV